jgi:4-hydroxybenzoate polyprenyltransferase
MDIKTKIKAYLDLTRAHFAIVWPLLFLSGLMLAFKDYNAFSWSLVTRVIFIGLFGFEAGMVLNDIIDRNIDKKVGDNKFTKYWRPFNQRPLTSGIISLKEALVVFTVFVAIAALLIATLPFPNNLYVYIIMIYAYSMEVFYQTVKRRQNFPFAQLLGRTDLVLFPVAGYLCYGEPTCTIFFYILFLYPWAQAHLGVNDIGDYDNDKKKDMKTITVLYGIKGNLLWISIFTLINISTAIFFILFRMGLVALVGFSLSFTLLLLSNILLLKKRDPDTGIKVLPIFHASLLIYILSIILDSIFYYPILMS